MNDNVCVILSRNLAFIQCLSQHAPCKIGKFTSGDLSGTSLRPVVTESGLP